MSGRFFYTDPLAAAWMGNRFGMRFLDSAGIELEADDVFFLFFPPNDPPDDEPEWDGKHFIHPDSLHLLEPQVGDVVLNVDDDPARVIPDGKANGFFTTSLASAKEHIGSAAVIIQRTGKAFHWPESEAA